MLSPIELPEAVSKNKEWIDFSDRLKKLAAAHVIPLMGSDQPELPSFEVACEICSTNKAVIYCDQDKAHLCAQCDEAHHSQSKLLMKHARLPVYHSPFQFGNCKIHKSDRYECVCLECGEMLCQLCLLVGSHAQYTDHAIVSTIEAFRLSLSPPESDLVERSAISKSFFAVREKKLELINSLKEKHTLVVQAEGNQFAIQQVLDKQLKASLEALKRIKQKRMDYLESLRRENLLLLTLCEWFQAFAVHARLSMPPSLWLSFFHHVGTSAYFREFLFPSLGMEPVDLVSHYIDTLPKWITRRVDIHSSLEVYVDDPLKPVAIEPGTTKFEWIPPKVSEFDTALPDSAELSPDRLRQNRMATRLDELLSKPQEFSNTGTEHQTLANRLSMSLPVIEHLVNDPVPLDNVNDFVMQTLAVLAETENRIPNLEFRDMLPDPPAVSPPRSPPAVSTLPRPTATAVPAVAVPEAPPAPDQLTKLRKILSGGEKLFGNAVAVVTAAPSAERQDLIRAFVYLFRSSEDAALLEELIKALCISTVNSIESSSFLVSGISMLVPLTASFLLTLYPQDAVFLDVFIQDMVTKAIAAAQSSTDLSTLAETSIARFIALIALPSSGVSFPRSVRVLLRSVHFACSERFSGQVSIGVVSGLFLARVVSPRLLFCAPKSPNDMRAPQVITLMTRFIHRIAGAAAEGQSALSTIRTDDPLTISINTAISQTNGLITRCVLSVPSESLPPLSGGLSPRSAAVRIEKKLQEYGRALS